MKKREVLPLIKNCVDSLMAMSEDAAKIELFDNDQASRRLKRDITAFKNGPLEKLTTEVYKIREHINNKTTKTKKTES